MGKIESVKIKYMCIPSKMPNKHKFIYPKWEDDREFYCMRKEYNNYSYFKKKGRESIHDICADDIDKTGVFDEFGPIRQEKLDDILSKARVAKGHIFNMIIMFKKEDLLMVENLEIDKKLLKNHVIPFLENNGLKRNNIELMCAIHLDKPNNPHIHLTFFETVPNFLDKDGNPSFRGKETFEPHQKEILKIGISKYVKKMKRKYENRHVNFEKEVKDINKEYKNMVNEKKIRNEFIELVVDMPILNSFKYEDKDVEPFRYRIDSLYGKLLLCNKKAREEELSYCRNISDLQKKLKIDDLPKIDKINQENLLSKKNSLLSVIKDAKLYSVNLDMTDPKMKGKRLEQILDSGREEIARDVRHYLKDFESIHKTINENTYIKIDEDLGDKLKENIRSKEFEEEKRY